MLEILIPIYESKDAVIRVLNSIHQYKFRNIKFTLSDDSNILENDSKLYDKIRDVGVKYVKHSRTGNPVDNWNFLIKNSDANYFQLMHQDEFYIDITDLIYLDENIEKLNKINILNVYCYTKNFSVYRHSAPFLVKFLILSSSLNYLYYRNLIGPPSSLIIRKDAKLYYKNHLKWLVDVEYYNRLIGRVGEVTFIDANIYSYYNESSITNRLTKLEKCTLREQEIRCLKSHYSLKYIIYDSIYLMVRILNKINGKIIHFKKI